MKLWCQIKIKLVGNSDEFNDSFTGSFDTNLSGDVRKDSVNSAGESQFMSGSLNNLTANDIFMLQMDLLGFTE